MESPDGQTIFSNAERNARLARDALGPLNLLSSNNDTGTVFTKIADICR